VRMVKKLSPLFAKNVRVGKAGEVKHG